MNVRDVPSASSSQSIRSCERQTPDGVASGSHWSPVAGVTPELASSASTVTVGSVTYQPLSPSTGSGTSVAVGSSSSTSTSSQVASGAPMLPAVGFPAWSTAYQQTSWAPGESWKIASDRVKSPTGTAGAPSSTSSTA